LPGLRVVARTSSEQYRGRALSPQQIGRELGVEYLLSGTVRWEKRPDGESRVRVSPQLVRASTALATWQQPFDATLTDVFQVQADIASRVAQSLDVAIGGADRGRLATRPTRNLDAYDAYLRAEQLTEGHALSDPATMRAALGLYEQAVKLDSGFAAAWARMSEASTFLYRNAAPLPEHARRAQLAAERAVALAPADARGYAARGLYYATVASDNERALAELRRAGELAPQDVEVLRARSDVEAAMGRSDIALEDALRAVRLDPRHARSLMIAGRRMRDHRRYHEADSLFLRAQELAPRSYANLLSRITNRLSQGDFAGARALVDSPPPGITKNLLAARLANFSDLYWVPDSAGRAFVLGTRPDAFDEDTAVWALVKAETYALGRDRARSRIYADSARRQFARLLADAPNDAEERAMYAVSLAYRGRFDEALREGERAESLAPLKQDVDLWCYVQFQLVRIHLLAGQHGRALDRIERILAQPWYVTRAWLRIDPTFDPVRGDPRFQRIIAGASP
ncbi:MAG TPA: hypothetical protein VKA54_03375, partial [Gemmatimonadaceae bacterium]|nr:hypothetical protein [Gemmatimonadaceae bacterium]